MAETYDITMGKWSTMCPESFPSSINNYPKVLELTSPIMVEKGQKMMDF